METSSITLAKWLSDPSRSTWRLVRHTGSAALIAVPVNGRVELRRFYEYQDEWYQCGNAAVIYLSATEIDIIRGALP